MSLPSDLLLMTYVGGPYDGHAEWERPEFCIDGHERFVAIGELAYIYVAHGGRYVFAKAHRPGCQEDDGAHGPCANRSTPRPVLHSVVECDPRGLRT